MESSSGDACPKTESLGLGAAEPIRRFVLRVMRGPDWGQLFIVDQAATVVGSQRTSDIVLHDSAVSRRHCRLDLRDSAVTVTDLDSRNGTVVDGVAVECATLRPGALVTLGRTLLRFEAAGHAAPSPVARRQRFGALVGESAAMQRAFALLERAAQVDATLLLQGETGTGKELAARAVHDHSERRDAPFVVVDCGAIPAALMESELFGHERGAFTNAHSQRRGVFESAGRGTVFLDEIGELPLELQPKLLRVLDRREVKRVGGTEVLRVEARIVAATNRDLVAETEAGRFRSDLYFRLDVLKVVLPPLRERLQDVPLLVSEVVALLGADRPVPVETLARELAGRTWPGNVRELRNYVERALAAGGEAADAEDAVDPAQAPPIDPSEPMRDARERWIRYFERRYLEAILDKHDNKVTAAAAAAGLDRAHFHRLLARAGLR